MRRKISKRKRRDILSKGGVFDEEEWLYEIIDEENPRNDINSYISIMNSERPIPVTGVRSLWEK